MQANNSKSELFRLADEAIEDVTGKIRLVHHLEPINLKEEKENFLSGVYKNPRFRYIPPSYDPEEVSNKLLSLRIPRDEHYEAVYRRKIMRILTKNRIVQIRGSHYTKHLSNSLYPFPGESLVRKAEKILTETKHFEDKKNVHSKDLEKHIIKAFKKLDDWEVKNHRKFGTFTDNANRVLYINKHRKFSEKEPQRLVNHEVKVHIYRYENGRTQPPGILAGGFPNYLTTEEGLAVLAEEITGTLSKENMRDYAGRVIAVDSVLKEYAFSQTFERMKSFGFTDDKAWELTLRAHRGGGYVKDHVYLQGYYKVKKFVKKGGDVKELYVGKVGIGHLPKVRKLLDEEILNPPVYFPKFFKKENISNFVN